MEDSVLSAEVGPIPYLSLDSVVRAKGFFKKIPQTLWNQNVVCVFLDFAAANQVVRMVAPWCPHIFVEPLKQWSILDLSGVPFCQVLGVDHF